MNDKLKNIFIEEFLKKFESSEKKKALLSQDEQLLSDRKSQKLNAIREFLDNFVEQKVKVRHRDHYNKDIREIKEDQLFSYYDNHTSESWTPGISVWIDHPAEIEIAIPNNVSEGVVVIKVASPHPKAMILEKKYLTMEEACVALAHFIRENTVAMDQEYRRVINDHDKRQKHVKTEKVDDKKFFQSAPSSPPEKVNNNNALMSKLNLDGKIDKDTD